jgi:Transglutaminase-like superfamily
VNLAAAKQLRIMGWMGYFALRQYKRQKVQPKRIMISDRFRSGSICWLISAISLSLNLAQFANAGCDLQIAGAGPCLTDGTPGIAHVGDAYALKVSFNVVGTPSNAFRIKFTLANITWYSENLTWAHAGSGWWYLFVWNLNLDDSMPWSITLDPDDISGDTNFVNNTASGTFTPVSPSTAVELYSPRVVHGFETYTLNFQPGSGKVNNLWVLFGDPTSHGAQKVLSVVQPANSRQVVTSPYGIPVFEIARTNVLAATFQDTNIFTVQLCRMRVNPTQLRTVTWADMNALTTNWTQWLAPDQINESTNPSIALFVQQSLPANYRSMLTPYDTARTLHCAVMKKLGYQSPPPRGDAVSVLQDGVADCGGFAALLTACLRNVGIPARRISGFWPGDTIWHVRVEFHLPGVEWLVADPTNGNGEDPTGTYAFEFGYVWNSDQFLAVDVGDAHVMPYYNFPMIQTPNWWWSGGGIFNSFTAASYLQGVCALWPSNVTAGSFRFFISDVPNTGSVVIENSTNLFTWSPVATNPAAGNPLSYSFSATNKPHSFYRAKLTP